VRTNDKARTLLATSAVGTLIAGLLVAVYRVDASLARSMAAHILLMGAAAPVIAVWLMRIPCIDSRRPGRCLLAAVILQIALLYLWHLPAARSIATEIPGGMLVMQVSLALAAVCFWLSVLRNVTCRRWHAVLALLVTAKLFCLLGILLVFARRPLFVDAAHRRLRPRRVELVSRDRGCRRVGRCFGFRADLPADRARP
jgi:cytochrome c oxidase assembly factor CtaG